MIFIGMNFIIEFRSDSIINKRGFHLKYTTAGLAATSDADVAAVACVGPGVNVA